MVTASSRRPGYSRRAQYSTFASYVIAAAGALFGAILLLFTTRHADAMSGPRGLASDIAAPIGSAGAAGRSAGQSIRDALAGYFLSGSETAKLQREVQLTRVKLAEAAALAEENKRLKDMLGLKDGDAQPVAIARLIGSTAASTRRFATLGAGSAQGVRVGMPVRSPLGLVGRVLEVGSNTARVLLITDSESTVPVRRASDGVAAFATGRGDGTLQLRLVTLGVNPLKKGDAFVTSGSGGLYRPGAAIAVVTALTPDGAIARPLSDPGSTEFVVVEPEWVEAAAAAEAGAEPSGEPR